MYILLSCHYGSYYAFIWPARQLNRHNMPCCSPDRSGILTYWAEQFICGSIAFWTVCQWKRMFCRPGHVRGLDYHIHINQSKVATIKSLTISLSLCNCTYLLFLSFCFILCYASVFVILFMDNDWNEFCFDESLMQTVKAGE